MVRIMPPEIADAWHWFSSFMATVNHIIGPIGIAMIIGVMAFILFYKLRPAKKWSPEKINAEKDRIEQRFFENNTVDIRSVIEYLIQRYAGGSINFTQARYEKIIDGLVKKGIESKKYPAKYKAWQPRPQSNYLMSFGEFKRIIMPCLSRYNIYTLGYSEDDAKLLFDAASNDYLAQREAKEKLSWIIHADVPKITTQLKQNYEILIRAKEEGKKGVTISIIQGCSCFGFLDNTSAQINDMLLAYTENTDKAPLLPPPETICFADPERYYNCHCYLYSCLEAKPPFDEIDEFQDPPEIPANWKEHLIGARKHHIETLISSNNNEINEIKSAILNFDDNVDERCAHSMLMSGMKMQELRKLQHKIGLSGFRTKDDVARQIVDTSLSNEYVKDALQNIKELELDSLHGRLESMSSHGDYLKTIYRDY